MMNENKKRLVASALSVIFAMSFLTTSVFSSTDGDLSGTVPADLSGNLSGDLTAGGATDNQPQDAADEA